MINRMLAVAVMGVLASPLLAEDVKPNGPVPAPSIEDVERMHRGLSDRIRMHDRVMVAAPTGGRMFNIQFRPGADEVRKEKAAYLGVMAGPASATLREQLKLPRGIGLAVEFVDKDSPAAATGLAQHDVVTKLDDQWLVSLQQLAVLVRMHKPGDTVKITYIRAGETKTVDVKLVEKEVPVLEDEGRPMRAPFFVPGEGMGGPRGELRIRPDIEGGPAWIPATKVSVKVEDGVTTRTLDDGEHTLVLTTDKEGKKTLSAETVKDKEVVFSGPIDTDEQRKRLPAEVAGKLKRLEGGGGGIHIQVGGASGGVSVVTVPPQGAATVGAGHGSMMSRSDDEHTITLTTTNNAKHLLVKDKAGKVIFDGPVNTEEERKNVPAEVLKKLERMEKAGKAKE